MSITLISCKEEHREDNMGHRSRATVDNRGGYGHLGKRLGRQAGIFELPESVDSSAIKAESRDGVLRVVLPKLEKAQPRQIEVSVN